MYRSPESSLSNILIEDDVTVDYGGIYIHI